jgi:YD repeat-containing protein
MVSASAHRVILILLGIPLVAMTGPCLAASATSVTRSVGAQSETTTYDYDKVGQLKRATEPDGSWVGYTYDAAHRLTDVADSRGNTVHYTLDAAGNRTGEDWRDVGGALRHTITRTFDALGRLKTAAEHR